MIIYSVRTVEYYKIQRLWLFSDKDLAIAAAPGRVYLQPFYSDFYFDSAQQRILVNSRYGNTGISHIIFLDPDKSDTDISVQSLSNYRQIDTNMVYYLMNNKTASRFIDSIEALISMDL